MNKLDVDTILAAQRQRQCVIFATLPRDGFLVWRNDKGLSRVIQQLDLDVILAIILGRIDIIAKVWRLRSSTV